MELQAPLRKRLTPVLLALFVSLGAVFLWRSGHMKPGGAWIACAVSVFYEQAMQRLENIRVELLVAIVRGKG